MYAGSEFDDAFLAYAPLRNHWNFVNRESRERLMEVEDRIYASFPTLDSDDDDEEAPIGYSLPRAFRRYPVFWRNYARRL